MRKIILTTIVVAAVTIFNGCSAAFFNTQTKEETCLTSGGFLKNEPKISTTFKGRVTKNSYSSKSGNLDIYEITPDRRCSFAIGESSVFYRFIDTQNKNFAPQIEKLDANTYKVILQSGESPLFAFVDSDTSSIKITFGDSSTIENFKQCTMIGALMPIKDTNTREIPDLMPNPILFSDIFECGDKDRRKMVIH